MTYWSQSLIPSDDIRIIGIYMGVSRAQAKQSAGKRLLIFIRLKVYLGIANVEGQTVTLVKFKYDR
jgi:hypothetical protein